jgi:hypothetical protein
MTEKIADILINLLEERIDNYYQDIKDVLAKTMTEKPIDSGVCKWMEYYDAAFDNMAYFVTCINNTEHRRAIATPWIYCPFCGKKIEEAKP